MQGVILPAALFKCTGGHGCINGLLCCAHAAVRSGKLTDEVYGQEVMFVANDWHAALLPLLLTARFR